MSTFPVGGNHPKKTHDFWQSVDRLIVHSENTTHDLRGERLDLTPPKPRGEAHDTMSGIVKLNENLGFVVVRMKSRCGLMAY